MGRLEKAMIRLTIQKMLNTRSEDSHLMLSNFSTAGDMHISAVDVTPEIQHKRQLHVLLKRLHERAAAAVALVQGLTIEAVDPEDDRELSVTLVGRPCNFLDVCSPHDPYPTEIPEPE